MPEPTALGDVVSLVSSWSSSLSPAAAVSGVLVVVDVIHQHELYMSIPVPFTLPVPVQVQVRMSVETETLDGKMCTFEYMLLHHR